MELFEQRKGITPVIAIVLLLMVTVGAVGVVYTQFNSLVGNPQEQLNEQQRNQDTRIRISTLESNVSSIDDSGPDTPVSGLDERGTIKMTIQNSGSVSRNTTSFVLTAITGETVGEMSDPGVTCFTVDNSTILNPQESYQCNTGIMYPSVTKEVQLEVLLSGSAKTWTDTCHVRTTGAEIC